MALQAVPMTAEDIPLLFRIRDAALLPSQAPISDILFRPPFSPVMHERETERLNNGTTVFYKVVDGTDMIACMRASVVPERPPRDMASMIPPYPTDFPIGITAWESCWRQLAEGKKQSFGNGEHIRRSIALMLTVRVTDERKISISWLQIRRIRNEAQPSVYSGNLRIWLMSRGKMLI
jgi:hypothetical protein